MVVIVRLQRLTPMRVCDFCSLCACDLVYIGIDCLVLPYAEISGLLRHEKPVQALYMWDL